MLCREDTNVILVVVTEDWDVFCAFFSRAVPAQKEVTKDLTISFFSFESHGRCETPQRFVVKSELKDGVNCNTGR